MKKTNLLGRIFKLKPLFFLLVHLLLAPLGIASGEMDRQYALDSVGVLRPWDNVDGLFVEYLKDGYASYFASQARFKLQDISKADTAFLKSKLPYSKIIEDPEILFQLSRSLKTESLIRTKVYKEGHKYRFVLDWIHSQKMDVLGTTSFTLQDPDVGHSLDPGDVNQGLYHALDELFTKVPFVGEVTGRDQDSVTLSLIRTAKIKKGDEIVVGSLEEVKKHPLLKTIVDWRILETGRLQVDQVDGGVVFAHVLEELPGKKIVRFQKVTKIYPMSQPDVIIERERQPDDPEAIETKRFQPPRLGWVNAGLLLGNYGRESSSLNGTQGKSGSGFLYGAQADGQLWLNRNLFAELGFGFGKFSLSQKDLVTGSPVGSQNISGTLSKFKIDAGYTHYLTGAMFGPRGSAKLGYRRHSYTLPVSTTDATGPSAVGSLFVGLSGELPIRDQFGVQLAIELGLFKTLTETGYSTGTRVGSSDFSFFIGGFYWFEPKLRMNIGIDVTNNGGDFDSGATLSHQVVSFGPSLQFYF